MLVVHTKGFMCWRPCLIIWFWSAQGVLFYHSCTQHPQGRRRMWGLVSLVVLANVVLLGTLGFGLRRSGGMAQIFQSSPAARGGGSLVRAPPQVFSCFALQVTNTTVWRVLFKAYWLHLDPGHFQGVDLFCPVYG